MATPAHNTIIYLTFTTPQHHTVHIAIYDAYSLKHSPPPLRINSTSSHRDICYENILRHKYIYSEIIMARKFTITNLYCATRRLNYYSILIVFKQALLNNSRR